MFGQKNKGKRYFVWPLKNINKIPYLRWSNTFYFVSLTNGLTTIISLSGGHGTPELEF
jgi:hypothetical protein